MSISKTEFGASALQLTNPEAEWKAALNHQSTLLLVLSLPVPCFKNESLILCFSSLLQSSMTLPDVSFLRSCGACMSQIDLDTTFRFYPSPVASLEASFGIMRLPKHLLYINGPSQVYACV
jgi:hypothetical protein